MGFKTSMASSAPWRDADVETIRWVVKGTSPITGVTRQESAAKVVFNIPSAHVPSFISSGYLNRYDRNPRIGVTAAGGPDARAHIDRLLINYIGNPVKAWNKLYYGAVELNGSGVRYYGDVCLVLKEEPVDADTIVLDRNSFDLVCRPLRADSHDPVSDTWDPTRATTAAKPLLGGWSTDLGNMVVCKVLGETRREARRITIGAISQAVLADEDYIEVIRSGSFDVTALREARVAGPDAAHDALVADRLMRGPTPDWTALLYRHRRRQADAALRANGVKTNVVISSGRVRA
ncbi:hypothetical protein ABIC65_000237 [Sphingomonas trueperi]|uniref:hypothetical protein n=1 Tax=Sphingomonas trueperi TaxID=53317 RepID=UPI003398E07D